MLGSAEAALLAVPRSLPLPRPVTTPVAGRIWVLRRHWGTSCCGSRLQIWSSSEENVERSFDRDSCDLPPRYMCVGEKLFGKRVQSEIHGRRWRVLWEEILQASDKGLS